MGVVIVYLPLAIAAVYVKIFIDDPGLRGGHTARLYWPPYVLGSAEPTIVTIAPVVGSRATRAPCVTLRYRSELITPLTTFWPICWRVGFSVVMTCSPPL